MNKLGLIVCLTILFALVAVNCMANPAQLPTREANNISANTMNESSNGCIACQCIGACCGRCCYVPPYSYCINTGSQCYCG